MPGVHAHSARLSMRREAQTIHVNRRDDPGDAAMDVIGPVCTREEEMEGSFPFIFTATLLSTGHMMAKACKKCNAAAFADFLFEFLIFFFQLSNGIPQYIIFRLQEFDIFISFIRH